jgi:hypothetical protein
VEVKVDGDQQSDLKPRDVVMSVNNAVKTASLLDDGPDKDETRDHD